MEVVVFCTEAGRDNLRICQSYNIDIRLSEIRREHLIYNGQ